MTTPDYIETIDLKDPDRIALDEAYRGLPRFGAVNISIPMKQLGSTLKMLEDRGYCGIQTAQFNPQTQSECTIKAYKGKQGSCYDTGKTATYGGAALAVLDDDNHLIIAKTALPVCEKTALVYGFPSYSKTIKISRPEPDLQRQKADQPKLFDCDNFEENLDHVLDRLSDANSEMERIPLYYPGPFRKLILFDGTLVERGRVTAVPSSAASDLMTHDLLVPMAGPSVMKPRLLQNEFKEKGSHCLLEQPETNHWIESGDEPDYSSLASLRSTLRQKLISTITKKRPYFILTGSDPQDVLGCCPSDDVGEANRLVRAGILSAWRQPGPPDACPVTTYGFQGELLSENGLLQGDSNNDMRTKVLKILKGADTSIWRRPSKWALLAFVIVTAAVALLRLASNPAESNGASLYTLLHPEMDDIYMILLFHNEKRCIQCLNMEQYLADFVASNPSDAATGKPIALRLVNMNDDRFKGLINRFEIFTSTPVFVDFEKRKPRKTAVLHDAWKLHLSPEAFKEMIDREMSNFKNQPHE